MAESTVTADSKLTSSDTRRRIWAIVGASSGNLVEWFDFYVYSFCSLYFAHIFFPSGNTTTQLLQTAGVFAAGFLMRPIGGWLFGRIADKHGRKKSMLLSVCMMCFGSLVIACLPSYETIGTWAPALLLLARLFQGLSVGGEYGTSATYMSEVAVEGRKGFLRIISVCDVDRRTTASPTGCRGFTTHHGRRCTQRVGMAYSFRVRSCVSCCGVVVTSSVR
ncbi:truncayed alpha-ketoglutarate transport protein [Escherichia coli]|uniref:Truncayed alpha-ketoglutarate transport protein n=1 Tax=Escherichia coli TaxID=562 RepID=A0A376RFV1_ECOLX|nr:truncayed alpha-ketoglutarate transport protein [Escherichia coli]